LTQPVYHLERLAKVFRGRIRANDGISLEVHRGEIFGVFGPNGAGKTTMIKQMAGLVRPTSGRIELLGHDVAAKPSLVPLFAAYSGQRLLALTAHTAFEVLWLAGVFRGLSLLASRRCAKKLLERFELGHIAEKVMLHLSEGQRRLVALLATFMGQRGVLILDEPTNDLDPAKRRAFWDYLWELNHDRGSTVVLVTHNVNEAEQLVGRVAIIDRGKLKAIGTPGQLKRQVADTVRIELIPKRQSDGEIARIKGARRTKDGRWVIVVHRDEVHAVLQSTLPLIENNHLDDFRILTLTLEDVYVAITGKEWEDKREASESAVARGPVSG